MAAITRRHLSSEYGSFIISFLSSIFLRNRWLFMRFTYLITEEGDFGRWDRHHNFRSSVPHIHPSNTMLTSTVGLLKEFYKKSDDPTNHAEYADFFTPQATLIMGLKTFKGTEGNPPNPSSLRTFVFPPERSPILFSIPLYPFDIISS